MAKNRFAVAPAEERTIDGYVFASKKEMQRYLNLKLLERAKEITDLELQPKFPVFLVSKDGRKESLLCTYTADFQYVTKDKTVVIEEVKSSGTAKDASYRIRKKAAELYYGIKITVLIK